MTALDDILKRCDEVLALDEFADTRRDAQTMARALKAVGEALDVAEHYCGDDVASIRAAIERRLGKDEP